MKQIPLEYYIAAAERIEFIEGKPYWIDGQNINCLVGCINNRGYRVTVIKVSGIKKTITIHRLSFFMNYGYLPMFPKMVDHINRNKDDNRKINLREATHSINSFNKSKKKNAESKYKGVSKQNKRKKWQVYFNHKYVGCYYTEIAAAKAYDSEVIRQGLQEFAPLNFSEKELI